MEEDIYIYIWRAIEGHGKRLRDMERFGEIERYGDVWREREMEIYGEVWIERDGREG